MAIEKNNIYSNMLNKYKKEELHMGTVKHDQIYKVFGKEQDPMLIQVKIDGELCALVKDKHGVKLYSRGGRIRTNTPLTESAKGLPGEFVIIGELYVLSPTQGPQTYAESMSTLRKPESIEDEKRFRFSAFDIVELNNFPYVENYVERFKELKEFLGESVSYIHLAPYGVGDVYELAKMWKKYIAEGWEGLVVHATSGIYKVKRFFPIDLAVVGVTRNTGWENQIGAIQTAFMVDKNTFVLSSKVGTGLTFDNRQEWLNWALDNEVDGPNDEIIWVDPTKNQRIIEVRVEEFRGKEESLLRYDGHSFVESGKTQTVSLRKPVFVRIRSDKEFDPRELGFDQVPVWNKEKNKVVNASFPEHPDTVIFEQNQYYPKDIYEKDVYNYYKSVMHNILVDVKDSPLMTVIRTDGGDIVRKHAPADGEINAFSVKEYDEKINTGRMIELHRIFGNETKFIVVDVDPRPGVPFEQTKKLTKDLADYIEKSIGEVRKIDIIFSGSRGFHIYGWLSEPGPTKRFHDILAGVLEKFIEEHPEYKASLSLPKDKDATRLDITIFHEGGSIRVPYSLHKNTGLAAIPVDRDKLESFTPEMAKLNKLTKLGFVIIEEPPEKKAIAFDFDQTIFMTNNNDWYSGYINPDIVPLILAAKAAGNDIAILTARIYDHPEDIDFISNVLDAAGIPWDEITYEKKGYFTDFVDDRATNVEDALELNIESPRPTINIYDFGGK